MAATKRAIPALAALALAGLAAACAPTLDEELRQALSDNDVEPMDFPRRIDSDLVELGRVLFFDKELSGNRDIACSTCHHPGSRTGDDLSLSIGTGGIGLGRDRQLGSGRYSVRNAPELFSRGADGWQSLFWDGRITDGAAWPVPEGVELPEAIGDDILAAQVMVQIGHRDSMRGQNGDVDVNGNSNELAPIPDSALPAVWDGVMARLLAFEGYRSLFAAAFPDVPTSELGFEHAALAISAYERDTFSLPNSPWDRYLDGEDGAIVDPAKRGALLFYGDAGCGDCHEGTLLTDQDVHNLCAPQIGVGLDWGRGGYSGLSSERYAFRTPPLRQVSFTAPYFHSGSHTSLEGAVRYHVDACAQMRLYEGEPLDDRFAALLIQNDALYDEVEATADDYALEGADLSDGEISDIVQFLEALSDPDVVYNIATWAPDSVPSGLPVD